MPPDQYVGRLYQVINQANFPVRLAVNERPGSPCLIMVMESPHRDEFIGDLGPAKGDAGKYLRLHLTAAIDCIARQDMGLILVNSIQYQCSLGESTKLYRDKIFHAIRANGGREEFMGRLRSTFEPGDSLMNCCTKGDNFRVHSSLRHLVETAKLYQCTSRSLPADALRGSVSPRGRNSVINIMASHLELTA